MQKIFFGTSQREYKLPDLSFREGLMMAPLVIVIIWLGVYPQPVINAVKPNDPGCCAGRHLFSRYPLLSIQLNKTGMSTSDLLSLMPLVIISGSAVIAMLLVAIKRNHRIMHAFFCVGIYGGLIIPVCTTLYRSLRHCSFICGRRICLV